MKSLAESAPGSQPAEVSRAMRGHKIRTSSLFRRYLLAWPLAQMGKLGGRMKDCYTKFTTYTMQYSTVLYSIQVLQTRAHLAQPSHRPRAPSPYPPPPRCCVPSRPLPGWQCPCPARACSSLPPSPAYPNPMKAANITELVGAPRCIGQLFRAGPQSSLRRLPRFEWLCPCLSRTKFHVRVTGRLARRYKVCEEARSWHHVSYAAVGASYTPQRGKSA